MPRNQSPSLPAEPACWSWEPLPLPQPNWPGVLTLWQQDRCAICAAHRPVAPGGQRRLSLWEDHDHSTGNTRGYLCPRCNTAEGKAHPAVVFALYRERPPAAILGLHLRRGCWGHPADKAAVNAWENALGQLEMREREEQDYELALARAARRRQQGMQHATAYRPTILDTALSPLELHAKRVGLTLQEWWESREYWAGIESDRRRGRRDRRHPYWDKVEQERWRVEHQLSRMEMTF